MDKIKQIKSLLLTGKKADRVKAEGLIDALDQQTVEAARRQRISDLENEARTERAEAEARKADAARRKKLEADILDLRQKQHEDAAAIDAALIEFERRFVAMEERAGVLKQIERQLDPETATERSGPMRWFAVRSALFLHAPTVFKRLQLGMPGRGSGHKPLAVRYPPVKALKSKEAA